MQSSYVFGLFLLAASVSCAHPRDADVHRGKRVLANGMPTYKADCIKKRALTLTAKNPGAGTKVKDVFKDSHKDGFFAVDCIKDNMFYHGDMFGDHKHAFEGVKGNQSVSIVHYDAHVAKEDTKQMTHQVCFDFCRSIPEMLYFGLINGRGCYCAPYFQMSAGDSSSCDAVCPGDAGTMCGGKTKSSIFEMHSCDDTASVFQNTVGQAGMIAESLQAFNDEILTAAQRMNERAAELQKDFGAAGDPAAADLMQQAKDWAGKVQHAAEASSKLCAEATKTSGEQVSDFKSFEGIAKAEKLIAQLEDQTHVMEDSFEAQQDMYLKVTPFDSEYMEKPADAGKQYYEAMYFVDKAALGNPSTCSGDAAAEPIYDQSFDECALACDAKVASCVGFSFFKGDGNSNSLCFLLSNFKTATYYTGCGGGEPMKKKQIQFLQQVQEPMMKKQLQEDPEISAYGEETMCFAKLQYFEGTTLKPDGSGKCKQCFKEVTKADRCFK